MRCLNWIKERSSGTLLLYETKNESGSGKPDCMSSTSAWSSFGLNDRTWAAKPAHKAALESHYFVDEYSETQTVSDSEARRMLGKEDHFVGSQNEYTQSFEKFKELDEVLENDSQDAEIEGPVCRWAVLWARAMRIQSKTSIEQYLEAYGAEAAFSQAKDLRNVDEAREVMYLALRCFIDKGADAAKHMRRALGLVREADQYQK
jgi:hypothetical protein